MKQWVDQVVGTLAVLAGSLFVVLVVVLLLATCSPAASA